jgi:hypothetical protein
MRHDYISLSELSCLLIVFLHYVHNFFRMFFNPPFGLFFLWYLTKAMFFQIYADVCEVPYINKKSYK